MLQMAVNSDHEPKGVGPGQAGQLCRDLELAGARSLLTLDSDGTPSTGATVTVDAATVRCSSGAADRFRQQAFAVLARGLPLSVTLVMTGTAADGHAGFAAVCDELYRARCAAGAASSAVGIAVDPLAIAPEAAADIRNRAMGTGPLHVLAGSLMQHHCARDLRDAVWRQLRTPHCQGNMLAALAPVVTPPCTLLSAEPAYCVQPATAVQVPTGSAWLPVRLDVSHFADAAGAIELPALECALRRCVRIGDALHDLIAWPTAQLRHDAWLNRRLSIELTGFGDLAVRRALDPQRFDALQELCGVLRRMCGTLRAESRAIAGEHGFPPAFGECDPSLKFPRGALRNGWRSRWLEAVEAQAMRHRNLIAMSPWCVFPRDRPADFRYADLLPLLSFADAGVFPPPPDLIHWSHSNFMDFHRRAWAVLQQRGSAHQIAEGL